MESNVIKRLDVIIPNNVGDAKFTIQLYHGGEGVLLYLKDYNGEEIGDCMLSGNDMKDISEFMRVDSKQKNEVKR